MRLLISFAALLLCGNPSLAPAALAPIQLKAPAGGQTSLTGTVAKIDKNKLVITVANSKGELKDQTVRVDKKTKITVDGKEAALADLKPGQTVTVTVENKVAQTVSVTS